MSNFNQYEAAVTLFSINNNYVSQNIDNIYNQISEERKKKENFEYQHKSISENNLIMMLEIFRVKKEIEEIKNNTNWSSARNCIIKNTDVDNIIVNKNIIIKNIKNKIEKSHNYNLRPRNK